MKTPSLTILACGLAALHTAAIEPNQQEIDLANLIANDRRQQRDEMVYHPLLNMVARARALDMGRRDYYPYVDHLDPDGYGPNKPVQLAGYCLPAHWGNEIGTNYIESIDASRDTAAKAFTSLSSSGSHLPHLFGTDTYGFFRQQTRYGVGYANVPGSQWTHYWIFLSAPPSGNGSETLEPYAEWLFEHYQTPMQIDTTDDNHDPDHDGIPRITEFVFDFNPWQYELRPFPQLNRALARLECTYPIRPDLGSLEFSVKRSADLVDWTEDGVTRQGNTFSVPIGTSPGYIRFECITPFQPREPAAAGAGEEEG
jgi:hypothetical protein